MRTSIEGTVRRGTRTIRVASQMVIGLRRYPPLDPARVRLGTMRAQVCSVGGIHDVTGAANDTLVRYRFPGASDDQSLLARSTADRP